MREACGAYYGMPYLLYESERCEQGGTLSCVPTGASVRVLACVRNEGDTSGTCALRVENVTDGVCLRRVTRELLWGEEHVFDVEFQMPDHDVEVQILACSYEGGMDYIHDSSDVFTLRSGADTYFQLVDVFGVSEGEIVETLSVGYEYLLIGYLYESVPWWLDSPVAYAPVYGELDGRWIGSVTTAENGYFEIPFTPAAGDVGTRTLTVRFDGGIYNGKCYDAAQDVKSVQVVGEPPEGVFELISVYEDVSRKVVVFDGVDTIDPPGWEIHIFWKKPSELDDIIATVKTAYDGSFHAEVPTGDLLKGVQTFYACRFVHELTQTCVPGSGTADVTVELTTAPDVEKTKTKLGCDVDCPWLTCNPGEEVRLIAKLEEAAFPYYDVSGRPVDFYVDGNLLGTATTDENGVAELSLVFWETGTHVFRAEFGGDDEYKSASCERSFEIEYGWLPSPETLLRWGVIGAAAVVGLLAVGWALRD
ncbi:MAG: Ig-like domain-containing protein [Methermicoccaceae archaeon]